jgi:RNA polymerase sigma-70 factor (ECF subfamily)
MVPGPFPIPRDDEPTVQADVASLARLCHGDEEALRAIVHAHVAKLTAVAFALLDQEDLANDVVQDVFVALWEHRATLNVERSLQGYLVRAVRNRAVDVLRHEQRQDRTSAALFTDQHPAGQVALNAAERNLDEADFEATVHRVLRQLPPQPRKVFLLSWHAGLTPSEIAELLGVSVNTVYQQMYRATGRLAELFPPPNTRSKKNPPAV